MNIGPEGSWQAPKRGWRRRPAAQAQRGERTPTRLMVGACGFAADVMTVPEWVIPRRDAVGGG